jgi:hypothetical protein
MTRRLVGTLAIAAVLSGPACKSMSAGGSYASSVRDQMREYKFPKPCDEIWVDALKVLAAGSFSLVGNDRKLAEQEAQGVISNLLNRGHATTRDDDGVLEAETDSNGQLVRYIVRGKPAEKGGCYVTYIEIFDDRANSTERRHRDYDMELKLLATVDPTAAASVAEKADQASK